MSNLEKLKLLILEEQYPMFTDEQLQMFLDDNEGAVYKTASQLCMLKANQEKKITVGPITIENADPAFWSNLYTQYVSMSSSDSEGTGESAGSKYTIKLIKRVF